MPRVFPNRRPDRRPLESVQPRSDRPAFGLLLCMFAAVVFACAASGGASEHETSEYEAGARITLTLPSEPVSPLASERDIQPALRAFERRLPVIREQLPTLIASASDYAQDLMDRPEALLNVPYEEQKSFSEEFINRAGGLAHTYPTEAPDRQDRATEHDVVLMAIRSWEKREAEFRERIREYKEQGWKVTLIGSEAGRPDDLEVDYFIDNGAPSGAAEHGRVNVLANVVLGWMWSAEYVAAMTREGRIPAILISVAHDHAREHNRELQTPEGRHAIGECAHAVPEGELALAYHDRVRRMTRELRSEYIQDQITEAADVIAGRLASGQTVGLTGLGHLIYHEPMQGDVRSPMTPFNRRLDPTFTDTLDPGELLVWIGYMGINSAHADFITPMNEAEVDVVTSYAPVPPDYESEQATLENLHAVPEGQVAHIDQPWLLGDAEVELPCEPGRMAPISGVCRTLIFRMLDDAVLARTGPGEADDSSE